MNKIFSLKKENFKNIIFLFLPLLIVFALLIFNFLVSKEGTEVKVRIEAYDPFDVVRGRYLNISFEEKEYLIPEFDGVIKVDDDEEEYIKEIINNGINDESSLREFLRYNNYYEKVLFIYNYLDEDKKQKVCDVFDAYMDAYESNKKYMPNVREFEVIYGIPEFTSELCEIDYIFAILYDNINTYSYYSDDLFEFFDSLINSNYTFKEYADQFKIEIAPNDLDTYKYNDIFYLAISKDEDGFMKTNGISLYRDELEAKYKDCEIIKIKNSRHYYSSRSLIDIYKVALPNSKYFLDERIAQIADSRFNNVINSGYDVYATLKIKNDSFQITGIYIDEMPIEEFFLPENRYMTWDID